MKKSTKKTETAIAAAVIASAIIQTATPAPAAAAPAAVTVTAPADIADPQARRAYEAAYVRGYQGRHLYSLPLHLKRFLVRGWLDGEKAAKAAAAQASTAAAK